ncbi:MAG: GTPase Era [Bacteroidota bacterium]|nr:GTPase Era [Bacteroidota bacterium]
MKHKAGFVNIIGNPNVGKSTFMNAIIGEKLSIITNKVQTTRHRILGILNSKDYQIVFSDTPGIIQPAYKLQEKMMGFVESTFEDADIFIYVVEIGRQPLKDQEIYSRIKQISTPLILLLNKIDLIDQKAVINQLKYWEKEFPNADVFPVSCLNNFNLEKVLERIIHLLPVSPEYYSKDTITDKSERFFVEEIIREKILKHYKKEIPYSVQVQVQEFKKDENILRISTIIYVMRESQKRILIGHKGLGIKRIGTEARRNLEKFLGQNIYLETIVKVKKNWRDNINQLKRFGY